MKKHLVFSVMALAIMVGCYGRGSPDHEGFDDHVGGDISLAKADFENLKTRILEPHACLRCHGEMANEAGVRQYLVQGNPDGSDIYLRVKSGNMPKEGSPVPQEKVDFLRRYILELGTNPPPPDPPPGEPPFEATYRSMSYHLVQRSCLPCHATGMANGGVVLDTYNSLRANYSSVLFELQMEQMPPAGSGKPVPTEQVIQLFEQWGNGGFPE